MSYPTLNVYKEVRRRIYAALKEKAYELSLSGLELKVIPPEIQELQNQIEILHLNYNEIQDISPLSGFKNLHELYLSDNEIVNISALKNLHKLRILGLHQNRILEINPIANLFNLEILDLSDNQITDISPLEPLVNLRRLFVMNNSISNISQNFIEAKQGNYSVHPLMTVRSDGFYFQGNPIQSPPLEILMSGYQATLDYFMKLRKEGRAFLYETKLLVVGEGGAGKTTFCRKMKNPNAILPHGKESTKGIEIEPLVFPIDGAERMQLNIWDFGGQEIYHQTHQFFLTHRSLYILLTDNRRQDTDFNWWLETIQAFGGNSPILIVQNEKGDRSVDLNLREIIDRYGQVKQALAVNFETNRGVHDLRKIVKEYATKLEHIGEELPKSWVAIRNQLEQFSKTQPYISIDEYINVCKENGIDNKDEAMRLCRVYHNLGVLLHFADNAILKYTLILKNEWATDAVYKVLDDRPIIEAKGRFVVADCDRIWSEDKYKDKRHELLELMLKFDLCYRAQDSDHYILPQLLPADKPDYNWDNKENILIHYLYEEYMPKGLTNRLMARLNWYTDIDRSWKKGTVLYKQNTTAEVRETFGKKEITVRLSGESKKELLLFIDEEISRIHRSYSKISVKKLLGCICSECINSPTKNLYDLDALNRRKSVRKETIECDKSYEEVRVKNLIIRYFPIQDEALNHSIENVSRKKPKRQKLFVSYSKRDKDYCERLLLYLQQLERNDLISSWCDKELVAGEKWDERIKAELEESDIILFLCSQDMLSTDYIRHVEMKRAFEREASEDVVIVPIIVKACTWIDDLHLPENNALPSKGIPITDKSWINPDDAYMNIYDGLKKLLEMNRARTLN